MENIPDVVNLLKTINATQPINFVELFISLLKAHYCRYKNNNGDIKQHTCQSRCLALLKFIDNACYWSRFDYKNILDGKYLNEIHNFLVKTNFYKSLYIMFLVIYLFITDFKTLHNISIDSAFIRNVLGNNLSRNPAYNNKPGLKVHALVDSNRVAIAFIITDCNVHDSVVVKMLLENLFISKEIFSKYCHNFLADSAYSGFITVDIITSLGLNFLVGRNNQHVKKVINIINAPEDDLKLYKKRGIVENFFSNYLRVPCLINNYQRKIESYEGLGLFYISSNLAKKINTIITHKNDIKIKENEEKMKLEKKRLQEEKKM